MTRPPLEWEALVVGQRFGPYDYAVRPDVARALRDAVGDDAWDAVDGEQVAPPMVLTFCFLQLLESSYAPPPGVIHAAQDFELLAPVRVGAVLRATGTVTERYLRRGRRYYTVAGQAVDERGVLVARSRTTGLYPALDLRRTDG